MSGFSEGLDRTFLTTVGGTRITLGGLLLLFLIAAATLAFSWLLQRLIARGARAIETRPGPGAVFQRLTHYVVLAVGLGVGLDTLGINLPRLDVHLDRDALEAIRRASDER